MLLRIIKIIKYVINQTSEVMSAVLCHLLLVRLVGVIQSVSLIYPDIVNAL